MSQRPSRTRHVGDYQLASADGIQLLQDVAGSLVIAVRENVNLRPGEPASVDDAGMVQFVGDDVILGRQHGRNGPRVSGEAGLENDAGLHAFLNFAIRCSSCP